MRTDEDKAVLFFENNGLNELIPHLCKSFHKLVVNMFVSQLIYAYTLAVGNILYGNRSVLHFQNRVIYFENVYHKNSVWSGLSLLSIDNIFLI